MRIQQKEEKDSFITTYSQDFIYPDNVGYPIGGPDGREYAVIELHYNNPKETAGMCVCAHGLMWRACVCVTVCMCLCVYVCIRYIVVQRLILLPFDGSDVWLT